MRFRPTIYDIIKDYEMNPLLLIPKNGGLKTVISTALKEMGVDYLSFDKIDRDNYTDGNLTVQIYRGEDIPQIVEDLYFEKRVKAIGFTGDDLFDEFTLRNPQTVVQLLETVDWYDETAIFRRPTLRWISKKGEMPKGKVNIAVNRKYELTSRIAIEEKKQEFEIEPEIRVYSGNTEQTVVDGINDLCIEIVYSGDTIERNNLEMKDYVRYSDFAVIGVDESSPIVFNREYEIIVDRLVNPVENSYTCMMASNPNNAFKKMGEEFAEFLGALKDCKTEEDKQKVIEEFQDLLYTLQLNLAMKGVKFEEITKEMYKRLKRN